MAATLDLPVLHGSQVTLRAHTMDDLDSVLQRCLDPLTREWTTIPLEYTRDDAVEYLTSLLEPRVDMVSWAIECDGDYAGTIDLRLYDTVPEHPAGDIGFVTHPRFRARGVMSDAVDLAVTHGLDELGWEAVQWKANRGNVASFRAAWRTGFPPPTQVAGLLLHRGRLVDGWISTLRPGMPRTPQGEWADVMDAMGLPAHPAARR